MSGATIGGVVGGIVGSFFGPLGAQIGFMLGSAIGGYVDPEVIKTSGPKLNDAPVQTARDGIPIPIVWGTHEVRGNLIWAADIVETPVVTRDDGKGGGTVQEHTDWVYTADYAIGICRPIAGILIVEENNKIVYDARTDAELTAVGYDAAAIQQTRAASAAFLASGVQFYYGDEDQLPDSVIEAYKGVGNVSAYRGLAYMRRQGHDVTAYQGAIPQYRFVVVQDGEETPGVGVAQWAATNGSQIVFSDDGLNWPEASETADAIQTSLTWGGGRLVKHQSGSGALAYSLSRGEDGSWQDPTDEIGPAALAYIDGKWWAVGGDVAGVSQAFAISQSVDADSWDTEIVPGYSHAYTCVGGHHGLIVVGTNHGTVVYSTNGGDNWPGSTVLGTSEQANDIASDGTTVIMVSDAGLMQRTTNGADWTEISHPFNPSLGITRIVYSAGLGMWVATNGTEIGYSPNVNDWTLATLPGGWSINDLEAGDSVIVAVGSIGSGPSIFATTNGSTWAQRDDFVTGGPLSGVAWMSCDGTPIPGIPGYYVHDDGTICGPAGGSLARESVVVGTIVADICQREGLTEDQYDVSDLTDVIEGYRIASEGGGDLFIAPLLVYACADPVEYDGKLWFFKRGRASIANITMEDLAERDGDAIEWERMQEAELLRKNTITYISALATYTATTQAFERRGATVQAKGEGAMELPVVADDTVIAQLAEKRLKIAWSENEKCKFSLPTSFSHLTPTDVVTLTDANLVAHRVRIMQVEEEAGVLLVEAVKDREAAYIGTASAVVPTIPVPTPPTVRGPTVMVAFNGPPPNLGPEAKAGIWVAVRGMLTGWAGCDLSISFDEGVTFVFAKTLVNQARIGWLRSSISSSSTTIPVQFYGDSEADTITDAQIDAFQNVWAIKTGERAEFGQTQTWTPNGEGFDGTDNTRGLLGIDATSHNANDDFVMVDASCYYIPVDVRYKGFTLVLRATTIGTPVSENSTTTLVYDPPEIVWDGNGDDDEGTDGPDPDPGGAGTPGTPTARTIGATVSTPSLSAGEASAAANSAAINAAFAGLPGGGGTVRLPAGTYYIDTSDPIEPVNNSRLDLDTNDTVLRAAYSSTTTSPSVHRDILRIDGVHDVEIKGGQFIGYRDAWAANGGVSAFGVSEWAHGVYVTNSAYDFTIYDCTFEKFVGDGISVGRSAHDGHVLNVLSTRNRRQGFSNGGDYVKYERCEGSYIGIGDGTSPRAGLDIEVDGPETNSCVGVEVIDCYFHHNAGPGLLCYRSCDDITVTNLRSEYNTKGIYAYDSQNVAISGDNQIRWNKYEGIHLASTCANWDIDGVEFYSNKTQQYGTFAAGLDTTASPTSTQKAKHITVASTVTGTTYGTNEYGPV